MSDFNLCGSFGCAETGKWKMNDLYTGTVDKYWDFTVKSHKFFYPGVLPGEIFDNEWGHTDNFTVDEVYGVFEDLVYWVDTGVAPTP